MNSKGHKWAKHRYSKELGHEKTCTLCGEWWPVDAKFFNFVPSRKRFESQCIACKKELQSQKMRDKRSSQKTLVMDGIRAHIFEVNQ